MLMKKSPNELLEFIEGLTSDQRRHTIDIMVEYVLEQTTKLEEDFQDLANFDSNLNRKEHYSEAREYLKKFQLQK